MINLRERKSQVCFGRFGMVALFILFAWTGKPSLAHAQQTDRAYSYAMASSQTPLSVLAADLLGRERAADIVGLTVHHLGLLEQLSRVEFRHRPKTLGRDFCRQEISLVSFSPVGPASDQIRPEHVLARPYLTQEAERVALAPNCRLASGQTFVNLNLRGSLDAAMRALRQLAAARVAASGSRELTFSIDCRDEASRVTGDDMCAAGGRLALARLPVHLAWIFDRDGLTIGEPGQIYWQVRFDNFDPSRADVVMVRRIPAPF